MIIDLQKFVDAERPFWTELDAVLKRREADPGRLLGLEELRRFLYLHERTAADLAKINTFASEPETRRYLENLVSRAYGEIHASRQRAHQFAPLHWFLNTFPQTFRRRFRAFAFSVAITLVGCAFGTLAVGLDPEAKAVLLPFGHGGMDPAERVRLEERMGELGGDHLSGHKTGFSAMLMTHNTKVSITTMALGMSWGIGSIIVLFYNGVILGGICLDYLAAGQGKFLAGWLLPHGSIEIPAILIAGQAGLVLGGALIGWGRRRSLRERMREITPDLVTLIFGVAVMLVWAGIIEAFFSQYHEPVLPYEVKIGFGVVELLVLIYFLARAGAGAEEPPVRAGAAS